MHDGNLTACSHIVDFSHNPIFQKQQEGVDGVVDKQEMAGFREGSLDGAAGGEKLDLLSSVFLLVYYVKQMLKLICNYKVSQQNLSKVKFKQTYHFLFICKRVRNLGMTWKIKKMIAGFNHQLEAESIFITVRWGVEFK